MGYGDALMDSGAARVAQLTDPRKVRIMLGHRLVWNEIWDNNPRIATPDAKGDFQIIYGRDQLNNMRPYHSAKSETKWTYNLDFRPHVGEIYFSAGEKRYAYSYKPQIIIEPNIKTKASPNKQWPLSNWKLFVRMAREAGFALFQVGPHGTRTIDGARLIVTQNFRQACAVLANARAYVGHEGGLHHAAAALGIPGVVIFGGFTPVELTGYALHRNLGVSLGDACGMRIPCDHCRKAMNEIEPELVLQNLKGVLQ